MNAKHWFLTLIMLLASITFTWGGTVTDDFSESTFSSDYSLTKTARQAFSSYGLTSSAAYAGSIRWNKSHYLIFNYGDPSRIASTTSGGILTQVSVTWYGTNTGSLLVYGSNTAYTGSETAAILDADDASELLATITYPSTTSSDFSAKGYHYVAIIMDATLNVTDVNITWTEEVTYNVKMDSGYDSDLGVVTINGVDATAGATVTTAKAGDEITIEVTPELDYCLTGFTFGDIEVDLTCIGYLEEEETGTYKIIMPEIDDDDITFTPAFDDMPLKTPQGITVKDGSTTLAPATPTSIQSGVTKTFNYELTYNRSSSPAYDGVVTVISRDEDVFAVTEYTQPDDDGKGTFTIKGFTGTAKVEIQTKRSVDYYAGDALYNISVSPREVALIAEGSDGLFYAMENSLTDGKAVGIEVLKDGDNYYYDPDEVTLADIKWHVMTTSPDDDAFSIMHPTSSNYLRLPKSKLLFDTSDFEWWKDENDAFVNPSGWGPNYGGLNFAATSSPSYGVVEATLGANFIPVNTYSTSSSATFPDSRTLVEGDLGTICVPFDVPEALLVNTGAKFYTLKSKVISGDNLAGVVLNDDPETELVRGHSYIYIIESGATSIELKGLTTATNAVVDGSDGFVGCLPGDGEKMYVPGGMPNGDNTERMNGCFGFSSGKLRYVMNGASASIKKYRAYIDASELEVEASPSPSRRMIMNIDYENTPTGISELTDDMFIDWSEPVYNIMGVQVGKGTTGVLIQNGQKFIVQ